jgi:uncharacterized protein (DUF433 family)
MNWEKCKDVSKSSLVLSGCWVFSGTRVPVKALFENLEDGASIDEFLEWFPGVSRSQAVSVLEFASSSLNAAS